VASVRAVSRRLRPLYRHLPHPGPLDGEDGRTTVANPYHYVSNDPLDQVDPLGLRQQDADFNPCAGALSPQGEAYCQKHGAPPSTFCQTSVDQCLGLGGQYQGKTLDANQYRDPQQFRNVLRSYIGSEPQLRVRWIESLGGGSTAVAYMDARDFERAFSELQGEAKSNFEKQKEWFMRFAAKAAVSFGVATMCTFGFAICFGAAVAGTIGGTALLTASDRYFGHEVNWNENISDAGLAALSGVACRLWTGGGCLGSFVKSAAPTTPLTINAGKVAAIWITSFAMDKAVYENNMS